MKIRVRKCDRCGHEYTMWIDGGYKFCASCAHPAKVEQLRSYRRSKPCGGFKGRDYEYAWPWACSTCGLKYASHDLAVECCSGAWDGHRIAPHYTHGGLFWLLHGEKIKDVTADLAVRRGGLVPTDFKFQDTSLDENSLAPTVGS